MSRIHPSAMVAPGADLHPTVSVGACALIGAQVVIGAGTSVGAHCVIEGRTTLGADNRIHPFTALGGAPQDKKYAGEATALVIGNRNTIREFCTLNLGTVQDRGLTTVGDDNWIMASVHIAHDCVVGNHTILANNVALAGHVQVGDWAIIGGLTGVHQRVKIGAHVMAGFGSHIAQDVPPFMLASGNPLVVRGINLEGLRRRGLSGARLAAIRQMHRLLYRQGLTLAAARAAIAALPASDAQGAGDRALMLDFLAGATRGIVRRSSRQGAAAAPAPQSPEAPQ